VTPEAASVCSPTERKRLNRGRRNRISSGEEIDRRAQSTGDARHARRLGGVTDSLQHAILKAPGGAAHDWIRFWLMIAPSVDCPDSLTAELWCWDPW